MSHLLVSRPATTALPLLFCDSESTPRPFWRVGRTNEQVTSDSDGSGEQSRAMRGLAVTEGDDPSGCL